MTSRRRFIQSMALAGAGLALSPTRVRAATAPDVIIHNARISTLVPGKPDAEALSITGGRFTDVGRSRDILPHASPATLIVDAGGRRIIPGLNDSHLHIIRGGLNYNLELRWDGVPSLADGMRMLKEQVRRTPPGQWVRVVGGFSELQFAEKRLPTLAELNAAAPETPVFILHLYDRALLNRAALRAVGYTKETPNPPGAIMERDKSGRPTGLLIANPNAFILYKTLSLGPKLSYEHQLNSSRHFMREMNRLGLTSCSDAGGGFQNWPEDYAVIQELHKSNQLTVRIAYNLFTQKPNEEKEDFKRWIAGNSLYQGDDFFRLNGAGEMLVYSAADFEDFRVPRPDLAGGMESALEDVARILAKNSWSFRMHATYDETISRALTVFERINRDIPLGKLRWFFDHCETISEKNIERVRALGGAIAIQHRMAFQGEYFIARYGERAAKRSPPIRRMLEMGLPVGAGTDATRVASYNPWTTLYWLVSGKTVGGTRLYDEADCLTREEALRLMTSGSAYFSREEENKGRIQKGMYADLAILSQDYFAAAEQEIKSIESLLTMVAGNVVYGAEIFAQHAPPPPPVLPEWSPVRHYGGHYRSGSLNQSPAEKLAALSTGPFGDSCASCVGSGCSCWVF